MSIGHSHWAPPSPPRSSPPDRRVPIVLASWLLAAATYGVPPSVSTGGLPSPSAAASIAPAMGASGALGSRSFPPPAAALQAWHTYLARVDERLQRQLSAGGSFLAVHSLTGRSLAEAMARVRTGGVDVRKVQLRDAHQRRIEVPSGRIHHYEGTAFVPGATLQQALSIARDYDRYAQRYAPGILVSRVLARPAPDRMRVLLRVRRKKIVTVVYDTEHDVRYECPASDRCYSVADTIRVQEVEHAGTAKETVRTDGAGRLWRIRTIWRYLQADGGLYLENESIMLTRHVGFPASLVAGPLLGSAARDTVQQALQDTRRALGEDGP